MMLYIGPPQVTRQQQINNIEVMDGCILVHEIAMFCKGLWDNVGRLEPFKNLIHCSEIAIITFMYVAS